MPHACVDGEQPPAEAPRLIVLCSCAKTTGRPETVAIKQQASSVMGSCSVSRYMIGVTRRVLQVWVIGVKPKPCE